MGGRAAQLKDKDKKMEEKFIKKIETEKEQNKILPL